MNEFSFDIKNKMHSLTGDYSNTKEAIEDVLVLVNANTKALTHLANGLIKVVEAQNAENEKVRKELDKVFAEIERLKGKLS